MENNTQTSSQVENQNVVPNTPLPTETSPVMSMNGTGDMPKKSGVGSVIATVIIIALIILGALYFWGKRIETQKAQQALIQSDGTTTDETAAAADATRIETVSQDDSVNTLNSEVKTTNTTNLSPELQ